MKDQKQGTLLSKEDSILAPQSSVSECMEAFARRDTVQCSPAKYFQQTRVLDFKKALFNYHLQKIGWFVTDFYRE